MNVSDIPNWKKPIVNAGSTEAGLPVAIRQIKELNWMRPHDALGYEINDVVEAAESLGKNEPVANPDTSGNAAAMREALVAMVKSETDGTMERDDLCGRCMSKATMGGDCKHDGSCWVDKVMAALAASPSNCVVDSNAAAMREYAKRLVDAVKDADLCDFIYGSDFCKSCMYNPMCKAARDCEAALSAPPRNCDVGTAEEQSERMALFCKSMYATEGAICHKCPLHEHKDCTLGWAQMPYTEGGAE